MPDQEAVQRSPVVTRVPTPQFSAENFRTYMEEVALWRALGEVAVEKQGIMLWLALPRDHPSDIKELILAKVGSEELKEKTGVDKFVEAMNEAFKPTNESRELEIYTEYYVKMKRKEEEKVSDFVNRFDKAANFAKRHKMDLPTKVKGLKLLHDAGLSEQDMKLVLTEVDFNEEEQVYRQAKLGLAKYLKDGSSQAAASPTIKLEALTAEEEEVLVAKGWTRPGARGGGGSGGWKRGANRGGAAGRGGGAGGGPKKNENPKDAKGEIIRCPSCDSIRHLLADCPDSYENLRKFRSMALAASPTEETEEEEAYFTSNLAGVMRKVEQRGEAEDIILFTSNKQRITELGGETLGCLLLDCGCSSNVAGEGWWRSYQASLPAELQKKVKVLPSLGKKFRFGGGEVLPSTKLVKFPGRLAGKDVMFMSHVVDSNIPLLWSRPAMARAGTILDLPGDRANILGKWVELDLTGVGHYALDILPRGEEAAEQCLATLPTDAKEKEDTLRKLHRQFGHPRQEVMVGLLKKVNCDDKESRKLVTAIHESCATCKRFSPTPPRPVVSLSAASDFGEVLTLDLKEVKVRQYKYIFHMIDGFTRFTVSVFLKDKKPETIIHHLMASWVASYGRPGRCWSDVGGEFNNDAVRQLAEAIGCRMETTAGYSAWQNGLNERNHAVVDRCFGKIMNDNPRMDPTIALAWAVTAKNSYPMYGGFSSFQLVFGKQPKLPNIMEDKLPALEGVTTSQSLAAHITAMYAGRKAFSEAMCDEKVRKALRHKVRAVERTYEAGEQVYYRRDGDKAAWRGPATILANRGSAGYFLEHQGDVVRVAACRLVAVGEAEEQIGMQEDKEEEQKLVEPQVITTQEPLVELAPEEVEMELAPHEEEEHREAQPVPRAAREAEAAAPVLPAAREVPAAGDATEHQQEVRQQQVQTRARQAPAGRTPGRGPSARRQAARAVPYPKAGDRIQYRDAGGDWQPAEVLSRGGKVTSKHCDYFNVRSEGGREDGVHLDRVEWRKDQGEKEAEKETETEKEVVHNEKEMVAEKDGEADKEEALVVLIPTKEHGSEECVAAKTRELEAFKKFGVYEEVKDEGQERLSSRWVLTDKSTKTERKVKARLVCRGFEEAVEVQADSPTGSKETLHMLLAIAATKGWTIKTGDIKNAYLQGEPINREVHMEPPAELSRPGMVWRLLKAVYGMNDAGRRWYLKVEKVLTSLGCRKSLYDHCLFSYKVGGELAGILLLWVDDIFYAGTKQFEEQVMTKAGEEFMVGRTEEASFTYIGLVINTTNQGITMDQIDYIEDRLQPAVLKGGENKRPLEKEEMTLLRRLTGKINWAASQTRPDLSYTVVELSTKFKKGVLEDLKKANKAITRLTSSPTKVLFPKIAGGLRMVVYSDAAFQNLPDQISSGRGHIVMLAGSGGRAAPLGWTSNKVRRVVHSTVAAEALSLQMALSHAVFLRAVLAETLGVDELAIPIYSYIDSNNLHQAINSTKFVEDKRLRLDIAQIQECVAEHKVIVRWVGAAGMIADCLTKRGVKAELLMDVITSGFLPEEEEEEKKEVV